MKREGGDLLPDKGLRMLRHIRLFMFVAIGFSYITLSLDLPFVYKALIIICTLIFIGNHYFMTTVSHKKTLLLIGLDFIVASTIGAVFDWESNLYLIYFNIIAITLFFETSDQRLIRGFIGAFFLVWLSILIHVGLVRGEWHVLDDVMNVAFVVFGCIIGYLIQQLMLAREMVSNQYEKLNASHLELQVAHEQLRVYANQVEDLTSIQERNRIAREIHDTVGHKMTALLIQLRLAKELVSQNKEEGNQTIETCETIARDALQEIRLSVHTLKSTQYEQIPFQDRIRNLLHEFSTMAQIETTFKIEGDLTLISPSIQPTIKQMIQESLTNAVRHGEATQCDVEIQCKEEHIMCLIQDNGKGENQTKPGFGLVNMRERISQHGGMLRVESEYGKGFTLIAEFPLKQQQWQLGGIV